MGDDAIGAMFYAINTKTGEKTEIGKGSTIPELAPGGMDFKNTVFEEFINEEEIEIEVKLKTITKKRFIKLLMSMNHQRNEANIMHEEYMKMNKFRTELGMIFFEAFYKVEPKLKLKIGDEEFDVKSIKADNM